VAFVAVPRSGCSSVKSWIASVDGDEWRGHDKTTFRCCTESDLTARLPVMVTRHPVTRAVSIYNHGSFFCLPDRWDVCSRTRSYT